jgi:hypothetical protein
MRGLWLLLKNMSNSDNHFCMHCTYVVVHPVYPGSVLQTGVREAGGSSPSWSTCKNNNNVICVWS